MRQSLIPAVRVVSSEVYARVPEWVDHLIYDELHAYYQPSGLAKEFDKNLTADEDRVKRYLGTYFPRSLLESFVIFDSLFTEKRHVKRLTRKDEISILSIGSGTGGDLLGLLLALTGASITSLPIKVLSIEGNRKAHAVLEKVVGNARETLGIDLELTAVEYVFDSCGMDEAFQDDIERWGAFDFVLTSKFLNELVEGRGKSTVYNDFLSSFSLYLSSMGILVMIDVSSPVGESKLWVPALMNEQANSFISESSEFKTILPLICSGLGSECGKGCYSQFRLKVSHRHCDDYGSKMCFRAIGRNDTADLLSKSPAVWESPISVWNEKTAERCKELE